MGPRPFSGRRSRRSVRSGYAFAHSEGFGRLITSGRIMRDVGGTMGGGRGKVHNNNSSSVAKSSSSTFLPHTISKSKLAFMSSKTSSSTALTPPQPQESQHGEANTPDYPGIPLSNN